MLNPFLFSSKQLSQYWRDLRSQLTTEKSDIEHLKMVAKFWSYSPISAPFLDWDNPASWPDPWELLADMAFDPSSIALGMEYTLLLSEDKRWTPDRLELDLVCLNDKTQQLLILTVDNQHILNFEYGLVVSADCASKEIAIQQRYKYLNKMHKIKD